MAGQQNNPPVSPRVCPQQHFAPAIAVSAWLLAQLLFRSVIADTFAVSNCVLCAAASLRIVVASYTS